MVTRPQPDEVILAGTGIASVIRPGSASIDMRYVVYVLVDNRGTLYKGMTKDLNRRLIEHRGGHTKTTARMDTIKVAYTEEFDTFECARKRELYLKTAAGRRFLKQRLGH